MKVKVTKQELNECIAKAVARVLNEDEWDDILSQALAGDDKANAAAVAAGGDMGVLKNKKPAGTGKRGRPSKKDKEAADAALNDTPIDMDDALINSEEPEDVEIDNNVETDDEYDANFNMSVSNMSSDELAKMTKTASIGNDVRRANSELKRRKMMLNAYLEDGIKPDWGYIYNKETNTIEPDPRHADLGKSGGAWDGRGADLGGLNFSTAGRGSWFDN